MVVLSPPASRSHLGAGRCSSPDSKIVSARGLEETRRRASREHQLWKARTFQCGGVLLVMKPSRWRHCAPRRGLVCSNISTSASHRCGTVSGRCTGAEDISNDPSYLDSDFTMNTITPLHINFTCNFPPPPPPLIAPLFFFSFFLFFSRQIPARTGGVPFQGPEAESGLRSPFRLKPNKSSLWIGMHACATGKGRSSLLAILCIVTNGRVRCCTDMPTSKGYVFSSNERHDQGASRGQCKLEKQGEPLRRATTETSCCNGSSCTRPRSRGANSHRTASTV